MTANLKTKHNSERSAAPVLDYQGSEKPTSHGQKKEKVLRRRRVRLARVLYSRLYWLFSKVGNMYYLSYIRG